MPILEWLVEGSAGMGNQGQCCCGWSIVCQYEPGNARLRAGDQPGGGVHQWAESMGGSEEQVQGLPSLAGQRKSLSEDRPVWAAVLGWNMEQFAPVASIA